MLLQALAAKSAHAHPAPLAQVRVQIDTKAKTYELLITCDVTALVMGYAPGYLTDDLHVQMARLNDDQLAQRIKEIQEWFASQIAIKLERELVMPAEIRFPAAAEIRKQGLPQSDEEEEEHEHASRMLTIVVKGAVTDGVRTMSLRLPSPLGPLVLTARRDASDLPAQLLAAGQESQILHVTDQPLPTNSNPLLPPESMNCSPHGNEPTHSIAPDLITAGQYLALGFWHIISEGPDHILFVLGLFLLSAHWKPLLWQVTAFTLAHSITLALAMNGIIGLKASFVEPLIAASIVFIAIENLCTKKLQPWRLIIVVAFGLLHGLGFAGVLSSLNLPSGQFAPAIIGFNIGVEMGQLAVIGLAFLAVGWWRDTKAYRPAIIIPASLVIAIIGLYWTIERVIGG